MKIEAQSLFTIKDAMLEETVYKVSGKPFHVEQDLSYSDQQAILKSVDEMDLFDGGMEYISRWRNVALLWPEIAKTDTSWQNVCEKKLSDRTLNFTLLHDLRIIAPQRFRAYKYRWGVWENINAHLKRLSIENFSSEYVSALYKACILFPESDFKKDTVRVDLFTSMVSNSHKEEDVDILVDDLVILRFIAPNAFAAFALTDGFWRQARHEMAVLKKKKKWSDFAELSAKLAVIAAKEIINTPTEFRLVPPDELFEAETPLPLPVLRNF